VMLDVLPFKVKPLGDTTAWVFPMDETKMVQLGVCAVEGNVNVQVVEQFITISRPVSEATAV